LKNRLLLLPCAVFFLLLPLSCDWKAGVEILDGPDVRANMAFAGEDSDGNWATLIFREDNSVIGFLEDGNGSSGEGGYGFDFSYSYDRDANSGSIVKKDDAGQALSLFPGGDFKLEANGSRLVFTGAGLRLLQVRDSDADLEVPFNNITALPSSGSLDGTVWAATGLRTKDWTTLSIVSPGAPNAGTIAVSHSFDASRFYRAYADYDPETGEGTLAYIGKFKIEGDAFTFLNFYGHGGEAPFKRMR
jgi:hypothetical protein